MYFLIIKHKINTKPDTMYDKLLYYSFINMYTPLFVILAFTIIVSPLFYGLQFVSPIFSIFK